MKLRRTVRGYVFRRSSFFTRRQAVCETGRPDKKHHIMRGFRNNATRLYLEIEVLLRLGQLLGLADRVRRAPAHRGRDDWRHRSKLGLDDGVRDGLVIRHRRAGVSQRRRRGEHGVRHGRDQRLGAGGGQVDGRVVVFRRLGAEPGLDVVGRLQRQAIPLLDPVDLVLPRSPRRLWEERGRRCRVQGGRAAIQSTRQRSEEGGFGLGEPGLQPVEVSVGDASVMDTISVSTPITNNKQQQNHNKNSNTITKIEINASKDGKEKARATNHLLLCSGYWHLAGSWLHWRQNGLRGNVSLKTLARQRQGGHSLGKQAGRGE